MDTMPKPDISLIADKCLTQGRANLTLREERLLQVLFLNETRKGAFRVPHGDVLKAFCEHVQSEFRDTTSTPLVYDFLAYWRRRAMAASRSEKPPLAALVLFATWLEHWLNMVITIAKLRRGETAEKIAKYFAGRPRFDVKVDELGPRLGLSPLPGNSRGLMLRVIKTRNDFVHYTWQGDLPGRVHRRLANVRGIVSKCPDLLVALRKYEEATLNAPFERLSRELFPRAG